MLLRSAFLAALLAVPLVAAGQTATDVTLTASDGNTVAIDRDDYGVPHITADTEAAVFFGQGFATAQDRLFQLETFWRTATGRLAELQGSAALAQDQGIRTVYYTPAERAAQFTQLTPRLQTMISSYVDGINAYIDSTSANPSAYLPGEYAAGGFQPEPYSVDKAMAVMQFFIRRFGEIGGDELARLAELQAQGVDWFEANRPVNDPTASVTIEASSQVPSPPAGVTYDGPEVDPDVAATAAAQREALTASLVANGVPHKFGSFAAVISSAMSETGHVMLLGAPQMGQPRVDAKAVTAEYELLVGDSRGDGLHVAGMSVPGIPGVIIGRTRGRAWTFTTGATDNTDTFTLTLGPPGPGGVPTYLYDGAFIPAEPNVQTIGVAGSDPVTYTSFRSVYGPVYAIDADNGVAYSYRYAFENRELDMAEALLDAWDATSIDGFRAAAARIPVSFNMFYADKEQNIAYWHVGDYPIRPGDADPRLPLRGDGTQEWLGLTDFAQQPQSENPAQGYFANWNNKPVAWWNQGDNVRWTGTSPGGYHRYYDGVEVLKDHLESVAPVDFEELQELTRVVRTNAQYPEYPATYQQVIELWVYGSRGEGVGYRAENVIPPGQSGFIDITGTPSANFADQWPLYQSSAGEGPIEMKPFTFLGEADVATAAGPDAAFGLGLPFPNPAPSASTVVVRLDAPAEVEVAVYDALGRRVAVAASGAFAAGDHPVRVDASALAPGVYVVRLATDGAVRSQRLVVAR